MYNTVLVKCVYCDRKSEVQSKSGTCTMERKIPRYADLADLSYVVNKPITCDWCGKKLVVRISYMTSIESWDDGNNNNEEEHDENYDSDNWQHEDNQSSRK